MWLAGKLPVPQVLYFTEDDAQQFMLISEIPGLSSHDEAFRFRPRRIVTLLAEIVKVDPRRRHHRLPV